MSTLFTSTEGDVTDAGVDVAGDAADAASMTAQWAAGCGAFAINYARVLGKIFNTEGGGELVARLMMAQASSLVDHDVKQLRITTMVAFQ